MPQPPLPTGYANPASTPAAGTSPNVPRRLPGALLSPVSQRFKITP
ncbi:hypothetical protein [Streptomyces angustmyceticus]